MFTKAYKLTSINGTDFEITRGWIFLALIFTYSFRSVEAYERYLTLLDFALPFDVLMSFPESQLGMLVFAAGLSVGIYGSVILHEIGHALAAQHYGLKVKSIRLWIAGGVARIEAIPPTATKEFHITIAGPIVTAILIPLFYTISMVFLFTGFLSAYWFFLLLAFFNTGMLLLNLTPVLPLDGGRMFRATLNRRFDHLTSTRYALRCSFGILLGAAVVSIMYVNIGYALMAGVVGFLALAEKKQTESQYDHNGVLHSEHEFLIADQTVYFEQSLPVESREILTKHARETGAAVVGISDDPDFVVTSAQSLTQHVDDGVQCQYDPESGEWVVPPTTPESSVMVVDTFVDYLNLHGISVNHDAERYMANQETSAPAIRP